MPHCVSPSMRVMICEDQPLIAFDLQEILEAEGHEVIGVYDRAADAEACLDDVEFALLDVDLADGPSYAFAQTLEDRGVPFAFVTASRLSDIPVPLRGAQVVAKPYRHDAILALFPRGEGSKR